MKPSSTRPIPKYREVIGGHVYDTETASVVWRWDERDEPDVYNRSAHYGLMKNLWGQYFSYYCDDDYEGQHIIRALDQEGAIKWMERHCGWLVESEFGKLHEAGEGPAYTPKEDIT